MAERVVLEISGNNQARRFIVEQSITTVGRATDNNIILDDVKVSRYHARLNYRQSEISITDLGSFNGTIVNDVEIPVKSEYPLDNDDVIAIGSFRLIVHFISSDELPGIAETKGFLEISREFKQSTREEAESNSQPVLTITTPDGTKEYVLKGDIVTLGRDLSNNIIIDHPIVSNRHASLRLRDNDYEIVDNASTNGLFFNSQQIDKRLLRADDVIWIGETVSLAYQRKWIPTCSQMEEDREQIQTLVLKGRAIVTIGRDPDNTMVLDDIMASRRHARIEYLETEGTYAIEDLHSTNGTYINGNSITKQYILHDGDIIRIGSNKFTFAPGHLECVNESSGIRLDAINLNQYVGHNKNILQNISLSIAPREFIAVVGVSGAGKTTLLTALNGFKPANTGKVFINGSDLYRNFNAHRSQLGYVPQQDIIHYELTVFEALNYSAKLRLPGDTKQEARYKRIKEVLETLNLSEQKDLQIYKLSGGQRKRVSIGVELLTKPGLFFLDEATSGLDPGMESEMMRLLRLLSDQGHTIVIITHATRNVNRCDEVAFLAKGGHLAYYGPPEQALHYFGVSEFDDIYMKLGKESSPGEWAKKYRESPQYREFISQRLSPVRDLDVETDSGKKAIRPAQGSSQKRISFFSQLLTLSQRNLNVLLRDKVSLLLMLLIAPLISLLSAPFWRHNLLSPRLGDAQLVVTNLFIAAIVCCLTGSIAFIREIVKEADIYKRERMVALNIIPYVLSKVFMAVVLSFYQAAIFLGFFIIFGGWPQTSDVMIQVYITLFLATLAGAFQGLLISAIAPNQNVAPLLIIIILVLQLVFGGILPQRDRGVVTNQINNIGGSITSTKWAFESLLTISGLGRSVANDDCWQLTVDQRNALTEEYKLANCDCMGPNMFTRCNFPGIYEYYDKAVDEPEPVKPARPDKPPSQPKRPVEPDINAYESPGQWAEDNHRYKEDILRWSDEMEKYKATMDSYEADMNKYDKAVTEYTDKYKEWRKGRDQAVGKAEGVIKTIKQNYGQGFNVDIPSHWRSLGYIMLILFILLVAIQKLKDRV